MSHFKPVTNQCMINVQRYMEAFERGVYADAPYAIVGYKVLLTNFIQIR